MRIPEQDHNPHDLFIIINPGEDQIVVKFDHRFDLSKSDQLILWQCVQNGMKDFKEEKAKESK